MGKEALVMVRDLPGINVCHTRVYVLHNISCDDVGTKAIWLSSFITSLAFHIFILFMISRKKCILYFISLRYSPKYFVLFKFILISTSAQVCQDNCVLIIIVISLIVWVPCSFFINYRVSLQLSMGSCA